MEQERKLTICRFSLPIPKNAKINPSYQVFFITKAREKPPRDSTPLHSTRQEINHSTRERER
jgi:hypothetical protein